MDREQFFHYALMGLVAALLYVSFLIIKPFFTPVLLACILSYLLYPLYEWLSAKWPAPLASATLVLLCLVVVVIPALLILFPLLSDSMSAIRLIIDKGIPWELPHFFQVLGFELPSIDTVLRELISFFNLGSAADFISSVAKVGLDLFVLFFVMYYAFIGGKQWVHRIKEALPLDKRYKERLFTDIRDVTRAVIYGQFLTSVIQGVFGGVMLALFGVNHALVWGSLMVITSFVPVLGTPLVWGPIAAWELANGQYVAGFGILLVGGIVVMNIDNVIRPYLIGSRARLSTPIVLIGVLGGLKLFGFVGLLLGPLVLALLKTALSFYREEPFDKIPHERASRSTHK